MLSKIKKSLLDNYTAFSRAKTGAIYQIANLLYPAREKMFNEIKSVEESLLRCDMAYVRLAESEAMLVEKSINSNANIESQFKEIAPYLTPEKIQDLKIQDPEFIKDLKEVC